MSWDYEAVPQPGMAPEVWLKGRTLGGSSSINGTVYVRGAPADYDHWEAAGCPGWGWRDVGPHFVALENHELGASLWRGAGGPLRISVHPAGIPCAKRCSKRPLNRVHPASPTSTTSRPLRTAAWATRP